MIPASEAGGVREEVIAAAIRAKSSVRKERRQAMAWVRRRRTALSIVAARMVKSLGQGVAKGRRIAGAIPTALAVEDFAAASDGLDWAAANDSA